MNTYVKYLVKTYGQEAVESASFINVKETSLMESFASVDELIQEALKIDMEPFANYHLYQGNILVDGQFCITLMEHINFELLAKKLGVKIEPIEKSHIGGLIESKEKFLINASAAGMIVGVDYWVKYDGSVWSHDAAMISYGLYLSGEKRLTPLEIDLESIGLKPKEATEWLIKEGYLCRTEAGEVLTTEKM